MAIFPTQCRRAHFFRITMRAVCGLVIYSGSFASSAEYYVSPIGSDENSGLSEVQPFATVTKALQLACAGDRISLRGGVYREQVRLSQGGGTAGNPVTLSAFPGESPILKGSDTITEWTFHSGAIWKRPSWPVNSQQVFCDDKLLQQIGLPAASYNGVYIPVGTGIEDMTPGSFFYDTAAQTLYIWLPSGDDPNDHMIEASTRRNVLWLDMPFIHVSGLTVRHSNSSSSSPGGIGVLIGSDSVIENCDIQWCDFEGLELRNRSTALNCVISNNGDVGVGAGGVQGYTIRRCSINNNNYRKFNTGWHAGGLKLVSSSSGTVEECEVSGNQGHGIWFDWCKTGNPIVIRNNYIRNNLKCGVMVEASTHALVYNNQLMGNRERGIFISGSDYTKAINNTIISTSGYAALSLGGVPRTNATLTHNRVFNNIVFGSICTFDLIVSKDNGGDVTDNLIDYNCYFRTSGSLSLVTNGVSCVDLPSWRSATGFDSNSLSENPQFNLASPDDFSTSPMSPVVDKGLTTPEVPDDIRGQPRPQGGGQDIGAYETSWKDCAPPSPPSNLKATPTSWNSFHLDWDAATDNVGVAYYEMYRNGARYAITPDPEFDDTGLDELKTYQYFVLAIDEAGLVSGMSNVFTVNIGSPPDYEKPATPGAVYAVSKSKGSVAVSWDPATDNVGVTKYCVFRNGVRIAFANATWFTDSNLSAKTNYDYQVSAFDAAGNESNRSRTKTIKTLP